MTADSKPARLLARLDAIGRELSQREDALALLGLGSVGQEVGRLDDYSDLDFFVVVQRGCQEKFLTDLSWLSNICPLAYVFQNTPSGHKLLFEDGIFCETAVFDLDELHTAAFVKPRVVWAADGFDHSRLQPAHPPQTSTTYKTEHLVGEALTNLYVGLGRFRRGEKMTAVRFIEGYAVDRIMELISLLEKPTSAFADPYGIERRFEQRYPQLSPQLSNMIQGYERVPQSAEMILSFLDTHFEVNRAMKAEITQLLRELKI